VKSHEISCGLLLGVAVAFVERFPMDLSPSIFAIVLIISFLTDDTNGKKTVVS